MSLVLGVDVGSQSIKAVLVDEGGDVVATGSAAADHDARARRLGGAGSAYLLHRTSRRRPRGDRRHRSDAGRGDGSGQPGRRRRRVRCRRRRRCARRSSGWTNGPPSSAIGWSPRSGADLLAERTGLVADASHSAPKMMWIREHEPHGLAARGDAGAGRVVCAAPPHRLARPGCRERVVHDGVRRHPRRLRRRTVRGGRPGPGDASAGPPVDGGGRHAAARRRRRARAAGELRGGRRNGRRTRRVGRGRCDRARCRRRRHRHRRTGDDGRPRHPCATRSASSRPTAMRCPARG